jgi:Flp pilus assembly protein TadD
MTGGLRRAFAAGLAAWLVAACQGGGGAPAAPAPAAAPAGPDPLMSRYALEQARGLLREGRADAAERVLRRALETDPQEAALHRALARALEAEGRTDAARAAWARADALEPPLPPLPDAPVPGRGAGVLVAIVPAEGEMPASAPAWPAPEVESALSERLATRLPDARVLRADPGSVGAARQWLAAQQARSAISLAVERHWCGFTVKDGNLAVAVLRVASAAPGGEAAPRRTQAALEESRDPQACRREAVARALEEALADSDLRAALAPGAAPPRWSRSALRGLFPGIERNLNEALRAGRAQLAAGELGEAQRRFAAAAEIDPEDPETRAYLADTELTLELARELAARGAGWGAPESLDPRLSEERRAAAERALDDERRRRDQLLAALAVLDEDVKPPPAQTLAALHATRVPQVDAFGAVLARERGTGEIALRIAFAPDGSELARYYVAAADGAPLVREEDTDADGLPDRWIAYRSAARSDIYERRPEPEGLLHFVFAEGGEPLQRVELDRGGDGRPERVFRYVEGRLDAEEQDTDGDGRLDRFDRFDAAGRVAVREEDLDGDGAIDVRSRYQAGRLIQREFSDPLLAPES